MMDVNLRPRDVLDNKEDVRLVWFNENMNNSLDYLDKKREFRELNPAAQFYSDINRCFDLIKTIKDEQIFLIFSGDFTQHFAILTGMYHHRNLVAIFIVGNNNQDDHSLLTKYNKIIGLFTDQENLLNIIREKINLIEKQRLEFKFFDQEQSKYFIGHQILKQLPRDEQSIQQIVDMCHDYYQNNEYQLKKIEEFKENYTRENVLEWFNYESFIYKLLNKAFRTNDIEVLYIFRSFIIDLCDAIEQKSKDVILYRETQMSMEEIQKLKDNINKTISTNSFLLTSQCIDIALQSTRSEIISNDFHPVLLEIQTNPSVTFAEIKYQGEENVLFNLNILFKINSVNFDTTLNLWKVQLTVTDEGKEKIEEHEMKQLSPVIRLGRLFMNQSDQVEKYFHMLLKTFPSDHPDIYTSIGNIHLNRNESDLALKNYEKAYELNQKDALWNLAIVYSKKCQYDLALDYYQKAEKLYSDDKLQKAMILDNIGRVYGNKDDFNTAIDYLSRALEIYRCVLPENHHDIALCLGETGYIYFKKGDFKIALDFYHQQLNIDEQCLSFDHPDVIIILHLIVDTYTKMGEMNKALEFCQEKLNIQKNKWGDNHPHTIQALMIIGDILKTNNPTKSLEYYEKAQSILENFIPSDLQTISKCLTSIAGLYAYFTMFDKALECELKVNDLNRQILISDHPDVANNLRNIGICYAKMNKLSETLHYFNDSLEIFRANFGEEHGEVKRLLTDINKIRNILMLTTATHKSNKKSSRGKLRR